jgi:hypothetical protein
MYSKVVGVGVLRPTIGMMRQGAKEVEVDAVHWLSSRVEVALWQCH